MNKGTQVGVMPIPEEKTGRGNKGKAGVKVVNKIVYAALAFTFSEDKIAVRWANEQKIVVHEVPSCKKLQEFTISTGGPDLRAAAGPVVRRLNVPATMILSPDGTKLAAYADINALAVWDLNTGKRICSIAAPLNLNQKIDSGAFSPDGRSLALDMNDGSIRLYGSPPRRHEKPCVPSLGRPKWFPRRSQSVRCTVRKALAGWCCRLMAGRWRTQGRIRAIHRCSMWRPPRN